MVSEISQVNQAAGQIKVRVSTETFWIVYQACHFAACTHGAFDPTVQERSERTLSYRDIFLDSSDRSIALPAAFSIDLGGIAKGYALDRGVAQALRSSVVDRMEIDFGGQWQFWSRRGTFEPVEVSIENPRDRHLAETTFTVTSTCSVSTSSNVEQPGHVRDPRVGRSCGQVTSATVVAPTGILAEVLSTALFVANPLEAEVILGQFPETRAWLIPATSMRGVCVS